MQWSFWEEYIANLTFTNAQLQIHEDFEIYQYADFHVLNWIPSFLQLALEIMLWIEFTSISFLNLPPTHYMIPITMWYQFIGIKSSPFEIKWKASISWFIKLNITYPSNSIQTATLFNFKWQDSLEDSSDCWKAFPGSGIFFIWILPPDSGILMRTHYHIYHKIIQS